MVMAAPPFAIHSEWAIAVELRTVPSSARTDAMRACCSKPMNFGSANAARMPRITITTTSSMSVKPRWVALLMSIDSVVSRLQKISAGRVPDHFPQGQEDAERQREHHAADEHDQDRLDGGAQIL